MEDIKRLTQHMNNGKVEYVMCAANWINDGKDYHYQPYNIDKGIVFCGWRHPCIFHQYGNNAYWISFRETEMQGFLTTKNRFLTRDEALELVKTNGQLKGNIIGGVLTSEDLW